MSDGAGILFKLRPKGEERDERDGTEAALAVLGSLVIEPSPFVAEAVAAMMRQAKEQGEMMRQAFAAGAVVDAATLLESRALSEGYAAAVHAGRALFGAFAMAEEFSRLDGFSAQAVKQAGAACRHFAEYLSTLPEEEREELRRAALAAPLCPVDVDASDAGVM